MLNEAKVYNDLLHQEIFKSQFIREYEEFRIKEDQKLIFNYLMYFELYHKLLEDVEFYSNQLIPNDPVRKNQFREKYFEINMKNWCEPFKSMCQYTPMEKISFLTFPRSSYNTIILYGRKIRNFKN